MEGVLREDYQKLSGITVKFVFYCNCKDQSIRIGDITKSHYELHCIRRQCDQRNAVGLVDRVTLRL